jgi:PAS domain S-box-containing protein
MMRVHRLTWLVSLVAVLTGPVPGAAQVAANPARVVAIYGGDPRTPYSLASDQALREAFEDEIATGLEFYSEYLDTGRFEGAEHFQRQAEFLRGRYAGRPVSLVFAMEPAAFRFLMQYRQQVFPGVPIVYTSIQRSTIESLKPPSDVIGVPTELDPQATIRLATTLVPSAREFVVVRGPDEIGRLWETMLRSAIAKAAPDRSVRSLSSASLGAIEREVSSLTPASIVLVASSYRREGGGPASGNAMDLLQRLRSLTGAPIFSTLNQSVGRGAVGSVSVPPEARAEQVAAIGKAILAGSPPESIQLPPPLAPRAYVDWRELRHWNIPDARVPPDTVVMFRPPGLWEQHRYYVLAALGIVLVQAGLIAALVVQRFRGRRIESALRESEAHFRTMADTAPVLIWRSDLAGKCDFVNRPWLAFTGRSLTDELGDGWLATLHPEDRNPVRAAYDEAFERQQAFRVEARLRRADGTYRWMLATGVPRWADGAFAGFIGSCLDISDRKHAEQALQDAYIEVGRMSRLSALGEFAATIAHEIRQPLTAIIMNARTCLRGISDAKPAVEDLRAGLLDIVDAGQRAEEVLQRNRRLFREHLVEAAPIDINAAILEAVSLVGLRLAEAQVVLETTLNDKLPAAAGDRIELQQVIVNLLTNAVDAMVSVDPQLRRIAVSSDLADSAIKVSISDTGVGFSQVDHRRLFTLAYTTKPGGTGVGLSISRSIVEAHGGRLWAETNSEGGATFSFSIPIISRVAAKGASQSPLAMP